MIKIAYRRLAVGSIEIFYREAGRTNDPALLLLHGFPTASHMFRGLIPQLAERFHVIAPDLPGFGQSDMPERTKFSYTFDNIAGAIDRFIEVVGLDRFAVYVFDYGAPFGFRISVRHPQARHPPRRGSVHGYRTFRARNPRRQRRHGHPRIPAQLISKFDLEDSMSAIVIDKFGGPENLVFKDLPDPEQLIANLPGRTTSASRT
jgi:pimeloyl-ACP methyl ester carboxylesterase